MGIMTDHMRERATGESNICLFPPLPASLNIELNNTCNQKCVFCPEHGPFSRKNIRPCHMDKELAKSVMKKAYDSGVGRKELGLYINGEVFLYRDLPEVIKFAKDIGFPYVFITTNGALAYPEIMREVIDAGLDSIRFSVNAVDSEVYRYLHGSDDYAAVEKNIRFLATYRKKESKKIAVSLSCVVTKKTRDQIPKIKERYGGLVDEILFIPVMNLRSMDKDLAMELELSNEIYSEDSDYDRICPIIFNSLYIEATGDIALCCNLIGENIKIGRLDIDSISSFDFNQVWNGEDILSYRRAFLNRDLSGIVCKDCNIIKQKAFREMLTGSFMI